MAIGSRTHIIILLAALAAAAALIIGMSRRERPVSFDYPFEINYPEEFKFERICNILDYGDPPAQNADITLAMEKAIDDCSEKGGGRVVVPLGQWQTGAIKMKSNIEIYLEEGAVVSFLPDISKYLPAVFFRFQGMELMNYSPLIYCRGCENISISGSGKLIGNGAYWQQWSKNSDATKKKAELFKMTSEGVPPEDRFFAESGSGLRPSFIGFIDCKNAIIKNISLEDSPFWTIHLVYSRDIKISAVKITNGGENTDGIVVDSSRDVLIEDAEISSGDDGIAVKSGLEHDGWRVNIPSEKIIIRNTAVLSGNSGVSIGSEMSGGVWDVYAHDLRFDSTNNGFRIKSSASRGGEVKNIRLENIKMKAIKDDAILLSMFYDSKLESSETREPKFSNIFFEDISVSKSEYPLRIKGLSEKSIEEIVLENIKIYSKKAGLISSASNVKMKNVKFVTEKTPRLAVKNAPGLKLENFYCAESDCVEEN